SILRWSLGSTQSSALNSPAPVSPCGTCAAILAGRSDTSKLWIGRIPDPPAISLSQFRSRPTPSGVTKPMPVTTTRRMSSAHFAAKAGAGRHPERRSTVRFDKTDGILDGHDLLGCVIRDFAPELLFEGHHEFDRVQTVGAQIVDKARVFGHF